MSTTNPKSSFLLILRQPPGAPPSPEALKKIMTEFHGWMESLRARAMVIGTNGLDPTAGQVLRGAQGLSVTDGPYAEGKEIVGGYVLIEAASFEEAVAAARDCPGLAYQMSVEVRAVIGRR